MRRSRLSTMGDNNNMQVGRRFDSPIPVDGRSSTEISASSSRTPYCKQGLNVYMRTSWTADNPGRHFFACPIQDDTKQCNFFQWLDGERDDRPYAALTKMHRKWQTAEKEYAAVRQIWELVHDDNAFLADRAVTLEEKVAEKEKSAVMWRTAFVVLVCFNLLSLAAWKLVEVA